MNLDILLAGSQRSTNSTISLSPLRIENGRLRNDKGFFHWSGVSDFYLPKYYQSNEQVVDKRLDTYQRVKRTGPRIFCSVNNVDGNYPIDFEILDWLYTKCNHRGLIPEFCLFAGRGQYSNADRKVLTVDFCQWAKNKILLPQLVNEAQFNDFDSAIDPDLLDLGEIMASWLGHRNFSITDSIDDASASDIYKELAKHSNILVWHPDRLKTGDPWRWVNHLKSFTEIYSKPDNYLIVDEPMGAASVDKDNRDSNPNHHIAANCVANCCGMGYTAHYIPEQDPTFPGLEDMQVATEIEASPDFVYTNAGLSGSPISSFSGYTKVRPLSNGHVAFAIGYGGDGSVVWDGYSSVDVLIQNQDLKLYTASR